MVDESPEKSATDVPDENPAPSKKELQRRRKRAEKALRKAETAKREAEKRQDARSEEDDVSQGAYGKLPLNQSQEKLAEEWESIAAISGARAGETVVMRCRVHALRPTSSKLCFLVLRGGSSTIQAVIAHNPESISKEMVKFASGIPAESLVVVTAKVVEPFKAVTACTIQNAELHVEKLFVAATAPTRLPFSLEDAMRPVDGEDERAEVEGKSAHPKVNLSTRLDHRVLDLRTPANIAIFRLQSAICSLFREYLLSRQFIEIHTPKLIGAVSEGGANVFKVDYFKGDAFLAQSPQLYKQMLVVAGFEKVFEVGPVFRAENSFTHRHLTEFVGLDIEMAFKSHYHEVLEEIISLFLFMFDGLERRFSKELEEVRRYYPVPKFEPYPSGKSEVLRLDYKDAVKLLNEKGVELEETDDIDTTNEKLLGRLIKEEHGCDFYVVDRFPLGVRPFYTMPAPGKDSRWSNSYDFFMRGEEIMSGAQRIHDADLLQRRAKALDVPLRGLQDYMDSFKLGAPPHAGGGIGLERVLMLYLGVGNIRRCSLFPRDPHRLRP